MMTDQATEIKELQLDALYTWRTDLLARVLRNDLQAEFIIQEINHELESRGVPATNPVFDAAF